MTVTTTNATESNTAAPVAQRRPMCAWMEGRRDRVKGREDTILRDVEALSAQLKR